MGLSPGDSAVSSTTDPEKNLEPSFPPLTPVHSSGSTFGEALDAEASITRPPPDTPVDPEKGGDPGPPPNGGFQAWLQVVMALSPTYASARPDKTSAWIFLSFL